MLHMESIIKSIEQIFSLSEENISSLTVMLADIEAERIYKKIFINKFTKKLFRI